VTTKRIERLRKEMYEQLDRLKFAINEKQIYDLEQELLRLKRLNSIQEKAKKNAQPYSSLIRTHPHGM